MVERPLTGRVIRTAPRPANSLLSRRQEQKELEGGSRRNQCNEEGSAVGGHYVEWYCRNGQALPP